MTFNAPDEPLVRGISPFRRHMLVMTAEALVRNVPLAVTYYGYARDHARPNMPETTEHYRRVLSEGRQMARWVDNHGRYQRRETA